MKIGIYDPYLDTMSGGEKYMLSAALCLVQDHEVSIFWDISEQETITKKARMRFDFDLTPLHFAPSPFSATVSFWSRFLQSKKYDYIILLSDGSIPFLSCPTILHFQSPVEWVNVSLKTKIKLQRIKQVICNSQFTKSHIDKKFMIDSTVLYPPVTLPEKNERKKKQQILNVGRYGINHSGSSYKKQEVLASAFEKMVEKGLSDWELVFVMSVQDDAKDKLSEFQTRCKHLPIRFVINPQNTQLWEEYQHASIYWHASGFGEDLVQHPDRAEHFGISTVEAMGMGAVPVVINAGGQPESVANNKTGYLWNTQEELISQTESLIKNPKKREEMAEKGKEAAKKFSYEHFCTSLREIII